MRIRTSFGGSVIAGALLLAGSSFVLAGCGDAEKKSDDSVAISAVAAEDTGSVSGLVSGSDGADSANGSDGAEVLEGPTGRTDRTVRQLFPMMMQVLPIRLAGWKRAPSVRVTKSARQRLMQVRFPRLRDRLVVPVTRFSSRVMALTDHDSGTNSIRSWRR